MHVHITPHLHLPYLIHHIEHAQAFHLLFRFFRLLAHHEPRGFFAARRWHAIADECLKMQTELDQLVGHELRTLIPQVKP